jgi:hypothetical protein
MEQNFRGFALTSRNRQSFSLPRFKSLQIARLAMFGIFVFSAGFWLEGRASAQNINCQYGGQDAEFCHNKPDSDSNSTPHEATPSEIAIHNCLFHGKCWPKKKPADDAQPKFTKPSRNEIREEAAAARAAEAQRVKDEAQRIKDDAEAVRKQQADAKQRQQAFDRLKASLDGKMMDLGDTSVVDFRDLKDPDHATIPLFRGGGNTAWVNQITDPEVAPYAKGIAAIIPPLPIPEKDVPVTWKQLLLSHKEGVLNSADYLVAGWQMVAPAASKIDPLLKVIMIGGKTFLAGEDGAALYLVQKDQVYNAALAYLKNPAQSQQFGQLVKAIRENRPTPTFTDPVMLQAARAIADPKLRNSGRSIAWDAMTSRPAVAAMLSKATIEISMDMFNDKMGENIDEDVLELTEHKATFDALRVERAKAVNMLERGTPTASQRSQLKIVIDNANQRMADTYRVEKITSTLNGISIGEATDKIADFFVGPEKGESDNK